MTFVNFFRYFSHHMQALRLGVLLQRPAARSSTTRGIIAAPARAIVTAERRLGMPGGISERGRRAPIHRGSKVESR